jgi:hypothetical protein
MFKRIATATSLKNMVPRTMSLYIRRSYTDVYEDWLFKLELHDIVATRKSLKSHEKLKKQFSNANRLRKITEYWNFFIDTIMEKRCGYFIIKHPNKDILDEIIKMASSFGYVVKFKTDKTIYPPVDYVDIDDGTI